MSNSLLISSRVFIHKGVMSGSISRAYDADFRITSRSVNGGSVINFGFDTDGLLASAGALTLTRNAQNGFLTGTTLGSITDGYTYSAFGEVSGYTAGNAGSALLNVQYTRDALGRITQKVETVGGVVSTYDYVYDTAGRLTDVSKNGAVVSSYVYDANGNRVTATVNGVTSQGFYDLQDRMTKYGAATYSYTANGELQTKTGATGATGATGTTSYSYDVFGNLMSVALPDGTLVEYVIDGNDRRIGKKVNGALVQSFLYKDSLNPIAELDSAGNLVSRFIYATKSNVPDYMVRGAVTYRIISDHLGSPRLVVNTTTGAIAQRIDYDEFGNITTDTNPGFQPFGFAGGIYDQHTKLTRFGARDYDATTGRWTSKDPIRFGGGINLYGYVMNDPINFVDRNGLKCDWWDLLKQNWHDFKRKYIPDFNKARKIADEERKKRPRAHNDAGDAMRHSDWSRRMADEINPITSILAGYGHELTGTLLDGQPVSEALMDLHNNAVGRKSAEEGKPINTNDLITSPGNAYRDY